MDETVVNFFQLISPHEVGTWDPNYTLNHEGARHCRKPLGQCKGLDIFITLGLTNVKAFLYNSC